MTKGEFFDLFEDVHDDTIIAIDTPYGAAPVAAVVEKMLVTGESEVSAVMVFVAEVPG